MHRYTYCTKPYRIKTVNIIAMSTWDPTSRFDFRQCQCLLLCSYCHRCRKMLKLRGVKTQSCLEHMKIGPHPLWGHNNIPSFVRPCRPQIVCVVIVLGWRVGTRALPLLQNSGEGYSTPLSPPSFPHR